MSSLITLSINLSILANLHFQPIGQSINHGGANAVQTTGHFISPTAKLATGMKNCKYHLNGGNARLVIDTHGNPSAIVYDCDRIILVDSHINGVTKARQSLIHRIVNYLIDQVVQTSAGGSTDIHTGSLPDSLETFQYLDLVGSILMFNRCIIHGFFAHFYLFPHAAPISIKIREMQFPQLHLSLYKLCQSQTCCLQILLSLYM